MARTVRLRPENQIVNDQGCRGRRPHRNIEIPIRVSLIIEPCLLEDELQLVVFANLYVQVQRPIRIVPDRSHHAFQRIVAGGGSVVRSVISSVRSRVVEVGRGSRGGDTAR